jgi:hypothetical protein
MPPEGEYEGNLGEVTVGRAGCGNLRRTKCDHGG